MNPFKRIFITMNANLDHFINQVENHGAVASSAIQQVERAAVEAKSHHNRLLKDLEITRKRLADQEELHKNWISRARSSYPQNEQEALECVRRVNVTEREVQELKQSLKNQENLEHELSENLSRIYERLRGLKLKRTELAARHAQAEAKGALSDVDSGIHGTVQEIFDRWEKQIDRTGGNLYPEHSDSFAEQWTQKEENAALQEKLKEIVQTK